MRRATHALCKTSVGSNDRNGELLSTAAHTSLFLCMKGAAGSDEGSETYLAALNGSDPETRICEQCLCAREPDPGKCSESANYLPRVASWSRDVEDL
jgi:hypothetical protein